MYSASDLNCKFDEAANHILIPVGFKKSGIHYYKKTGTEYFAILKDTSRGCFMDYYLCYCHNSAKKQFELLSKKPSVMLKDYPLSITIEDLETVYNNSENLLLTPYLFYSLARQFKIDNNCIENIKVWNRYYKYMAKRNELLTKDKEYIDNYINNFFLKFNKLGFKFFSECSVGLCYTSILRVLKDTKMTQYLRFYQDFINSFEEYYKSNNISLPTLIEQKKNNWFGNFFNPN